MLHSMSERITNRVVALRGKKSATQEGLASAVGVSRQTIIALEKGNYVPSLLLALKISHVFKMPVEKIFTLTYEK